jgi:hypothetical protein
MPPLLSSSVNMSVARGWSRRPRRARGSGKSPTSARPPRRSAHGRRTPAAARARPASRSAWCSCGRGAGLRGRRATSNQTARSDGGGGTRYMDIVRARRAARAAVKVVGHGVGVARGFEPVGYLDDRRTVILPRPPFVYMVSPLLSAIGTGNGLAQSDNTALHVYGTPATSAIAPPTGPNRAAGGAASSTSS